MRHELHLARAGFLALLLIAAVATAVGGVVAGGSGARSAAIGVGLVATNHALAVLSTSWARTLGPRVIAVGYSVFVFRMAFVLGTLGTLQSVAWIHDAMLAGSFCAALVASLAAECVSYVRGSYVPAWRTR
jgi:hypothetical protein